MQSPSHDRTDSGIAIRYKTLMKASFKLDFGCGAAVAAVRSTTFPTDSAVFLTEAPYLKINILPLSCTNRNRPT